MCRREQTERAIDLENVLTLAAAFDLANQAMKLRQAKQLPILDGRFAANANFNAGGAEEYGLREGDVITLQQPIGAKIVEADQPLFAFQIGEQTLLDLFERKAQV